MQTCFLGWFLPHPGRLGTLALANPQVNVSACVLETVVSNEESEVREG